MAAWRRRAIEVSRRFTRDFSDASSLHLFSVYGVFGDLIHLVRDAHEANDTAMLFKIYGYAEWCLRRKEQEFWNAAGVSFYEHLFDRREDWEQVVPWLSPFVIENCWGLWEARSPRFVDIDVLRAMIAERTVMRYDDWRRNQERGNA